MQQFHSADLVSDAAYKATLQGDIFQLKLLMAVALRARKLAQGFVLNTEVKDAEKFDDLVIEYINTATVLQAKHTSKGAKYNKKEFLKDYKGEASLVKYFDSFIRMKDKNSFKNKPVQYVFFTNRGLEKDDFFDCLNEANEPDLNLKFDNENAKCWKFSKEFIEQEEDQKSIYSELTDAIKVNSSVYYQLLSQDLNIDMSEHINVIEEDIKNLIEIIVEDIRVLHQSGERNKFKVDLTGSRCKVSRNLLLSILQQVGEHTYTEFSQDFRENNNLTELQKRIRQQFITKLKSKLKIDETNAIQVISKIEFKYTKEISSHVWQPKNVPNTVGLTINEDEDNSLNWQPTKEQSYYLVGMFGQFEFKYSPNTDLPLSDLTIYKTLNKAIIAAIKATEVVNDEEVEEKFAGYLTDFFKVFRIKVGQPGEAELENIIQKELSIDFKFSGSEYYNAFLKKMLNWMKDIKGKAIDKKQLDDFFKQVSIGIERLHLTGYSIHQQRVLNDYRGIQLPQDILNSLKTYITDTNKKSSVMLLYGNDTMGLTLSVCQVIPGLVDEKKLSDDNWGFAGPDCRILDKVPEVLSKNYQLMVIDHVADLLTKPKLLQAIINIAIEKNKKLVLLCSPEKIADIKKLIPSGKLIEQKMPELSDKDVAETCKAHLNKYVFIAGREYQIAHIIKAKEGGIFEAMHTVSHLAVMLKNAKLELNAQKEIPVYVPQRIKMYTAFYRLKQIFNHLPDKHILLISNEENLNLLKRDLPECLMLTRNEIVQYSNDNPDDSQLDKYSIFEKCCDGKNTQKQLEKFCKSKVPIIINLLNKEYGKNISRIVTYLRQSHPIVIISEKKDFALKDLITVHVSFKNGNVDLPLDERHLFGQPEYELANTTAESAYTELNFIQRHTHNLSTCVSANPGTGKSENFRELTRLWSTQSDLKASYHWLILINLIEIDEQFINSSLPASLISYYCKKNHFNLTALELTLWGAILQYDIAHGYVKLLLDGWDEVKGIRKELVKKFISKLPRTIHYDLAMRPYVFNSAPGAIYQRVELQPFSDADLKSYFEKRFTKMSDDKKFPQCSLDKLNIFIDTIMTWVNNADEKMRDVVKIPLLAYLLSEALKDEWEDWLKSESETPDGPWGDIARLNLITLYEIFILTKSRIYLQKHIGIGRKEILGNDNQILQLVTNLLEITEEIAFAELFNISICIKRNITPEIYRALLDFAIIVGICEEELDKNVEYRYQFLQQTFKELFAALYIVKALMRSHDDPIYKSVLSTITHMRYEVGFKVVWRFVRDLLEHGSILLLSAKSVVDTRTVFTTPEDHIGVATRNLLGQLGLCDGMIKVHELSPNSIITLDDSDTVDTYNVQSENNLTNILTQLDDHLSNKDKAISLLNSLPAEIPKTSTKRFNEILGKALSSWYYRVSGDAAEKMSNIECEIQDENLERLKNVVFNTNCYSSERRAAIRAMLKVKKSSYVKVYIIFENILDDKKLALEFKVEVLSCLEKFVDIDDDLTLKIATKMDTGVKYDKADNFYQEALLRELLLIKLHDRRITNFNDYQTIDLIKAIAKDLTFSRLDLLCKLIDHEFLTLEEIKSSLIEGLTAHSNRGIASKMLAILLEYFKKKQGTKYLDKDKQEISFLKAILHEPKIVSTRFPLFENALLLLSQARFEINRSEDHWRFWRLDAGIPIAKLLLKTTLKDSAFAYLIYQVRENFGAYDVSNKVGDFLKEVDASDYWSRCVMLYIAFEYLVINQNKFSKGGYFRNIDEWSGMINRLVNLSWRHFEEGKGYPLIGLDVIFAIGVCYGLPLLEAGNSFKLLYVNINQNSVSSPDLNLSQRRIVKEHMSQLRDLSGKQYSLQQIIKKYDALLKEIYGSIDPKDKPKELEAKANNAIIKVTKKKPSIMMQSFIFDSKFERDRLFTVKMDDKRLQELHIDTSDKDRKKLLALLHNKAPLKL